MFDYGSDIARRSNEMLADAWSRRVLRFRTKIGRSEVVRKALNVESFAFGKDGGAIAPLFGFREFVPAEFHSLLPRDVEKDNLSPKNLPRTLENLALLTRADLETKENLRVSRLFERCCEKTEQVVATHSLTAKCFFDAIALVERTGSAATFITVHRDDVDTFIYELEGFRQEPNRTRRGLGFVGKFDGIDILVPTSVVENVAVRGCAWVTVAPEAVGCYDEVVAYHLNPYKQLLESEPNEEERKTLGWTVEGEHRLFIVNPYGVAKINFARPSQRKI
jgi:hypothetical protein